MDREIELKGTIVPQEIVYKSTMSINDVDEYLYLLAKSDYTKDIPLAKLYDKFGRYIRLADSRNIAVQLLPYLPTRFTSVYKRRAFPMPDLINNNRLSGNLTERNICRVFNEFNFFLYYSNADQLRFIDLSDDYEREECRKKRINEIGATSRYIKWQEN